MDDTEHLKPLLQRGQDAIAQEDGASLAEVVLELLALEQDENSVTSQFLATERQKLVTPDALAMLVRLLPVSDTPPLVRRALLALGSDAAEAILHQLGLAPDRVTRRAYRDALTEHPDANGPVLHALKSRAPQLLMDAAEVSGRRALELAIPGLEVLLRHEHVDVRMAAWHALEQIGTPTAMALLYP